MTDSKLAKLIIKRYKEQYPEKDWKLLFKERLSICDLFTWCNTKEGSRFWLKYDSLLGYNLRDFLVKNFNNPHFLDLSLYI